MTVDLYVLISGSFYLLIATCFWVWPYVPFSHSLCSESHCVGAATVAPCLVCRDSCESGKRRPRKGVGKREGGEQGEADVLSFFFPYSMLPFAVSVQYTL